MIAFSIFIVIAVVALVIYSILIVSSRQEELAQRIREENQFKGTNEDISVTASHSVKSF